MILRTTLSLALVLLPACASTGAGAASDMQVLEVGEDRILPAADLSIATNGSVCWFNASADPSRELHVRLDRPLGHSAYCAATLGFHEVDGHAETAGGVRPGTCATLCFEGPGVYRYEVTGLARPLSGTIRVVAEGAGR